MYVGVGRTLNKRRSLNWRIWVPGVELLSGSFAAMPIIRIDQSLTSIRRALAELWTPLKFATVLMVVASNCIGQTEDEAFRKMLREKAAFTSEDFSAVDGGIRVVKVLPLTDKREVAVCGVVKVEGPPALALTMFQQSMTQQSGKSFLAKGKFGDPPSMADVNTLTLEKRDIEDFKSCVQGNCKVKLSGIMMHRLRTEVDWNKADYAEQATQLFRSMLVDYVREYLVSGSDALIEYADQKVPVRVDEEQEALLKSLSYIDDFAPSFTEYLRNFPASPEAAVDNVFSWSKVKFGLKPVIVITHVATHKSSVGGTDRVLSISRQLYASHYFDSSLALTAVFGLPTKSGPANSYLLYINRARADALGGSFPKLKRKIIERNALDSLTTLLEATKLNCEIHAINQTNNQHVSIASRIVESLVGGKRLVYWLVAILALLAILALGLKRVKRAKAASPTIARYQNRDSV